MNGGRKQTNKDKVMKAIVKRLFFQSALNLGIFQSN